MALPGFLLRKLFKRGSLRQVGPDVFAMTLWNPLGKATVVRPPRFVINGVAHDPENVEVGTLHLDAIDEEHPFVFAKGDQWDLVFRGALLRGNNRIHITATTAEFGDIDFLVEAEEAASCDIPTAEASYYGTSEEE